MVVHAQTFMVEFGNVLIHAGIDAGIASKVITKLHHLEAKSSAYPNATSYPTPSEYHLGGRTAATFAQGLVMLDSIKKQTGNLKRIYGIGHPEFQRFIKLMTTLHDYLLERAVKAVWATHQLNTTMLTKQAVLRHQSYKHVVARFIMNTVAPLDSQVNGVIIN